MLKTASSNKAHGYILSFCSGAILYSLIEYFYKGNTHFTMVILGGICAMFIYRINRVLYNENIIVKALMSAVVITILEFLSGIFLNIFLGLKIWDYSDRMFHILGQICPLFSMYWFLISIPAIIICQAIDNQIIPYLHSNGGNNEQKEEKKQ